MEKPKKTKQKKTKQKANVQCLMVFATVLLLNLVVESFAVLELLRWLNGTVACRSATFFE